MIRDARLAGRYAASSPIRPITATAIVTTEPIRRAQSEEQTSRDTRGKKRAGNSDGTPAVVHLRAGPSTVHMTRPGEDPSAMRIPISLLRWST